MSDTIRGPVKRVLAGDLFEMQVTHLGKKNIEKYNDHETVRIAGINAPEPGTETGDKAKKLLEERLAGKEVRCTVQLRDADGLIVADVTVL